MPSLSKAVLLAASILASTSSASPASTSDEGTLAIPLAKRTSAALTLEDGSVDWAKAQAHLARVNAKFVKGAQNYNLNTGAPLFSPEAAVIDSSALGRRAWEATDSDSLEWAGDEAMYGYEQPRAASLAERDAQPDASEAEEKAFSSKIPTTEVDVRLWYGTVQIGTPGVPFILDFDTGSADLWIPSASCNSAACNPHSKYDPSASSTSAQVKSKTLSLRYGDGSSTSGLVYTDTVTMAGLTASAQVLGAATSMSSDWADDPMDGMMGMGYQSISQLGASPFFQTVCTYFQPPHHLPLILTLRHPIQLVSQNTVAQPQFSFKLDSSGSELFLGGMNPSLYVSWTTEWTGVTSQSYWVVKASASANGNAAVSGFNAIIDSGTSAPTADAQAFWASVPNSAVYGSGYYTYPCASPPTIGFTFTGGSTTWTLSADSLNLGKVSTSSPRCVGSIVGADVGVNGWILGDAFMENMYTTFDLGSNRVGFSQLA
ncbi:hypothetical protein MNV49_004622 [Pseudohyphozyma bogoriensis]|nr:hypothetical protein MNV49_004622 [Pseudohyphozyma bogoriensis]